jgi:hypothetical protein
MAAAVFYRRRLIGIWQCDAFGSYRHPRGAGEGIDAGFQGFGSRRTAGEPVAWVGERDLRVPV